MGDDMSTSVPKFIDAVLSMFYQYLTVGRRPNMEISPQSDDGWTAFLAMMKDARLEMFKPADNPDWDKLRFRRVEIETSIEVTLRISVRRVNSDNTPDWTVETVEWKKKTEDRFCGRALYFFPITDYQG